MKHTDKDADLPIMCSFYSLRKIKSKPRRSGAILPVTVQRIADFKKWNQNAVFSFVKALEEEEGYLHTKVHVIRSSQRMEIQAGRNATRPHPMGAFHN